MTDRELLELVAKAAGVTGEWARTHQPYGDAWVEGIDCGAPVYWNPLTEDGDALRLAVKLGMELYHGYNDGPAVFAAVPKRNSMPAFVVEMHDCDPHAATRRAITRAAAEIGKAML